MYRGLTGLALDELVHLGWIGDLVVAVEWRVELRVDSASLPGDLDQPRLVVERTVVRLLDRSRSWLVGVGLHCMLFLLCVLNVGSRSS